MMNEQIGKYMTAVRADLEGGRKTYRWEILDRSAGLLGIVAWYPRWRQYCFESNDQTVFSSECLHDIAEFINRANIDHKSVRSNRP